MEVQKVCGFKDSNGKFWDTEKEAVLSNKKIKLRKLEMALFRNEHFSYYKDPYHAVSSTGWRIKHYMVKQEEVRLLRHLVYMNPDIFIEFCKLAKEVADETDKPEEIFTHNPKKPWWNFW